MIYSLVRGFQPVRANVKLGENQATNAGSSSFENTRSFGKRSPAKQPQPNNYFS